MEVPSLAIMPALGGGICNNEGSITISGSTISNNIANYLYGGGIYNYDGSITISGSTISNNSARDGGGGKRRISARGAD